MLKYSTYEKKQSKLTKKKSGWHRGRFTGHSKDSGHNRKVGSVFEDHESWAATTHHTPVLAQDFSFSTNI